MSPEIIALADKLSFTGFLLIAVYMLYRDTRNGLRETINRLSATVSENTIKVAELSRSIDLMANVITVLVDASNKRAIQEEDTKPLPSNPPPRINAPR